MKVISGKYGGLHIQSPRGNRTHPMGERIKSSLFNMLGDLTDLNVLDAYAGSGAIGIEALSRGAKYVQFVDNDPKAYQTIKKNLNTISVESKSYKVTNANIISWSKNNQETKFDLIVIDPPFGEVKPNIIEQLAKHLTSNGLMVLSYSGRESAPTVNGVVVVDNRSYGDAALAFYRLAVD